MCSILGLYNIDISIHQVEDLNSRMSRRGPDNGSVFEYEIRGSKLYLAHNRLAIQDLDSHANQPFENEYFSLVFNGEIYNHLELRKHCNYAFQTTNSDTETLIALFTQFSFEEVLKMLNGMFAIGLYNKKTGSVSLARDRVGIKPLYWTLQGEKFGFSSELKAFPDFLKENVDNKSLIQFMSLGYIPNSQSYYESIHKLEAGHYLIFDGQEVVNSCYWDLPSSTESVSFSEAVLETERLIRESIKCRLLSDLEVGCFLSGGVDSSLVSAIMQDVSSTQIKTFTIGFEEAKYNEAIYAKGVAKHIGSAHNEYTFSVNDVKELLIDFETIFDEPFGDASALPTMLLSKFTKENVTVALSGDGGDELFLGYKRYFFTEKYYNLFKKIPYLGRVLFASLGNLSGKDKMKKMAYPVKNLSPINFYSVISTSTKPWELETLFSKEFVREYYSKPDYLGLQQLDQPVFNDMFEDFSRIDFKRYLVDDILTKVDKASMNYSLEARVPLLDHNVVEYAYSLSSDVKLVNGPKSILKEVLYKYVPRELIERPKMGFGVPLNEWFRDGLKDVVQEKINNLDERFNKAYLQKLFDDHQKGANYEYVFWNLLQVK